MGSIISMLFVVVSQEDIKLPVSNRLDENNSIWQLFEDAEREI